MGDSKDGGEGSPRAGRATSRSKKKQRIEVDVIPPSYHPGAFTITAYLPQEGNKRKKVKANYDSMTDYTHHFYMRAVLACVSACACAYL